MMLFIASKVINFILEGFNPRKAIMIISNQYETIGQRIQDESRQRNHGVGWTWILLKRETTSSLRCSQSSTINANPTHHSRVDPNAFVIITDVNQVIGEGFTFYLDDNGNKFLH